MNAANRQRLALVGTDNCVAFGGIDETRLGLGNGVGCGKATIPPFKDKPHPWNRSRGKKIIRIEAKFGAGETRMSLSICAPSARYPSLCESH